MDGTFYENKWWKIIRYECTLIERDRLWWINIIDSILLFHEDLLEYKNNPEKLNLLKTRIHESKKRKIKKGDPLPQTDFQLISDDEEE